MTACAAPRHHNDPDPPDTETGGVCRLTWVNLGERPRRPCDRSRGVADLRKQADVPDRTCIIPGCGKPLYRKRLCAMHESRLRRTGTTDPRPPYDMAAAARRFWSKVDQRGDRECWPWLGLILSTGYGQATIAGRKRMAHRVAYELAIGSIPEGFHIDHVRARGCTRTDCVNPAHLEAVTPGENTMRSDSPSAINARKTCCPRCGGDYEYDRRRHRFCRRCKWKTHG